MVKLFQRQWIILTCGSLAAFLTTFVYISFTDWNFIYQDAFNQSIQKKCPGQIKPIQCHVKIKSWLQRNNFNLTIEVNDHVLELYPTYGKTSLLYFNKDCQVQGQFMSNGSDSLMDFVSFVKSVPHGTIFAGAMQGGIKLCKDVKEALMMLFTRAMIKNKFSILNSRSENVAFFIAHKGYGGLSKTKFFKRSNILNSRSLTEVLQLGFPFQPMMEIVQKEKVENIQNSVQEGGHWYPKHCSPLWKIAIVVCYRSRKEQLYIFLENMHRFLQAQHLEYQIFIVDQSLPEIFNRAGLFNIGFLEAKKVRKFDCYSFHDVDLIPEHLTNYYGCPENPRHLTRAVSKFQYRYGYPGAFGGAVIMTDEQFEKINGFSNLYFGWGGEDDDAYRRLIEKNMTIIRYAPEIARYVMHIHKHEKENPHIGRTIYDILNISDIRAVDGINSCIYKVLYIGKEKLFTRTFVQIEGPVLTRDIKKYINTRSNILRQYQYVKKNLHISKVKSNKTLQTK